MMFHNEIISFPCSPLLWREGLSFLEDREMDDGKRMLKIKPPSFVDFNHMFGYHEQQLGLLIKTF